MGSLSERETADGEGARSLLEWEGYSFSNVIDIFDGGPLMSVRRDNIRTLRAAYDIGAFRITELITEQRRLLDAQREYTEALTERYRALADLQAALGGIQQ